MTPLLLQCTFITKAYYYCTRIWFRLGIKLKHFRNVWSIQNSFAHRQNRRNILLLAAPKERQGNNCTWFLSSFTVFTVHWLASVTTPVTSHNWGLETLMWSRLESLWPQTDTRATTTRTCLNNSTRLVNRTPWAP